MSPSVALIVNQPNPEKFAGLRSAIAQGLVEHPYNTLAQFALAVQQWPKHAQKLSVEKLSIAEQVRAFDYVSLLNYNSAAGFSTRGIGLNELQAHPLSELLLAEIRRVEPKLLVCFGIEPYIVMTHGLGLCEMRDPIVEGSARQYVSSMNESGQVIANFGYFRENDVRINLMYTDFVKLLDWCAKKD